jgi:hypothetical protein
MIIILCMNLTNEGTAALAVGCGAGIAYRSWALAAEIIDRLNEATVAKTETDLLEQSRIKRALTFPQINKC